MITVTSQYLCDIFMLGILEYLRGHPSLDVFKDVKSKYTKKSYYMHV
mgnify:CR=1 FL=1